LQQAKQSATSATHLVHWNWTVSKCSDTVTNVVFETAIFLIPVEEVIEGKQAVIAKPATAFPEFVYITVF